MEEAGISLAGGWIEVARIVRPAGEAQELLDCHPVTVRRWISRFNAEGAAGLTDRPR